MLPIGGGPNRTSPVLIPKGMAIVYSVYIIYRRPDLYGIDAKLYRPERWDKDILLNYNETYAKWGYLLYNSGLRICLGSKRPLLLVKLGSLLNINLCFLL
jgi:cytochrome P450